MRTWHTLEGKTGPGWLPANRLSALRLASMALIAAVAGTLGCGGGKAASHTMTYSLENPSMSPTIYPGDTVLVDTSYYRLHRVADGDIVAFFHQGVVLIKRVEAIAGDRIEGRDGVLVRNGVPLHESYASHDLKDPITSPDTFPNRKIADGQLFMVGDARTASYDSRSVGYGAVYLSDIIGRVQSVTSSSHPGQAGQRFF